MCTSSSSLRYHKLARLERTKFIEKFVLERYLEYAFGITQSAQGAHHHKTSETNPNHPLRQPLSQAHPKQRPEHRSHYQRRQPQEVAEARCEVAYRGYDRGAQSYRQARRNRSLRREAESNTIRGTVIPPPPTPTSPESVPMAIPASNTRSSGILRTSSEGCGDRGLSGRLTPKGVLRRRSAPPP